MCPDAIARQVSPAPSDEGDGGGRAKTTPSRQQLIWKAITDSIRLAWTAWAARAPSKPVSLDALVDLLTHVLSLLVTEGVLSMTGDGNSKLPRHPPVILRSFGQPTAWWYSALTLAFDQPWLPRCV